MFSILKKYPSILILSFFIFLLDQVSKFLVVKYIPLTSPPTIFFQCFSDFFQIIHVRNTGTLFSIGYHWSFWKSLLLLKIFPTILVLWIALIISIPYYVFEKLPLLRWIPHEKLDTKTRFILSIVLGGGLGNVLDRLTRTEGVVDFLDFKFYGIFGLERWPTFNVADMSVVISMLLLIFSSIHPRKKSLNSGDDSTQINQGNCQNKI